MERFRSKKLVAYFVADLCWSLLLLAAILKGIDQQWMLVAMVVVKGFVQVGYILGQSYVDVYAGTIKACVDKTDS